MGLQEGKGEAKVEERVRLLLRLGAVGHGSAL
jgi:hypothetical protein